VNADSEAFFRGSQVYPVALLRRDGEFLLIASAGMKTSQRFMILTPAGNPDCRPSRSVVIPMLHSRFARMRGTV
jgi:hypothetical protein